MPFWLFCECINISEYKFKKEAIFQPKPKLSYFKNAFRFLYLTSRIHGAVTAGLFVCIELLSSFNVLSGSDLLLLALIGFWCLISQIHVAITTGIFIFFVKFLSDPSLSSADLLSFVPIFTVIVFLFLGASIFPKLRQAEMTRFFFILAGATGGALTRILLNNTKNAGIDSVVLNSVLLLGGTIVIFAIVLYIFYWLGCWKKIHAFNIEQPSVKTLVFSLFLFLLFFISLSFGMHSLLMGFS